jgi:hypothetical protein
MTFHKELFVSTNLLGFGFGVSEDEAQKTPPIRVGDKWRSLIFNRWLERQTMIVI